MMKIVLRSRLMSGLVGLLGAIVASRRPALAMDNCGSTGHPATIFVDGVVDSADYQSLYSGGNPMIAVNSSWHSGTDVSGSANFYVTFYDKNGSNVASVWSSMQNIAGGFCVTFNTPTTAWQTFRVIENQYGSSGYCGSGSAYSGCAF